MQALVAFQQKKHDLNRKSRPKSPKSAHDEVFKVFHALFWNPPNQKPNLRDFKLFQANFLLLAMAHLVINRASVFFKSSPVSLVREQVSLQHF